MENSWCQKPVEKAFHVQRPAQTAKSPANKPIYANYQQDTEIYLINLHKFMLFMSFQSSNSLIADKRDRVFHCDFEIYGRHISIDCRGVFFKNYNFIFDSY